jgi:hypothetical protein
MYFLEMAKNLKTEILEVKMMDCVLGFMSKKSICFV